MIRMKKLNVIGQTCYDVHADNNLECKKRSCKQWINNPTDCNCVIVTARKGPSTLSDIGRMFNVTRMRICQIEQEILDKMTSAINP